MASSFTTTANDWPRMASESWSANSCGIELKSAGCLTGWSPSRSSGSSGGSYPRTRTNWRVLSDSTWWTLTSQQTPSRMTWSAKSTTLRELPSERKWGKWMIDKQIWWWNKNVQNTVKEKTAPIPQPTGLPAIKSAQIGSEASRGGGDRLHDQLHE